MLRSIFRQSPATSSSGVRDMNVMELKNRLDEGDNLLLLDVRTTHEYQQDGHIDGARLVPLAALAGRINELGNDRPIVCICRSGNRSRAAAEWLLQAGHGEVYNLVGGMMDWHRHRLPAK